MGILISRFRKNKTTIEILEDLDKKIKDIESYGQSTEQKHKRIVGILILYSVALYVITVAIFYFYFFPASFYDLLFFIIPLLAFPIFIFISKKLISWYYKRKISRNQEKLETMQKQKKKILDDVTETETYKKAKEILMKFAPDQLRTPPITTSPQMNRTVALSSQAVSAGDTPRRAPAIVPESATITDSSFLRRRALTAATAGPNSQLARMTGTPGGLPTGAPNVATPPAPYPPGNRQFGSPVPQAHNPLPRPILPQQRSYLDKLVEYLVGDGPSNRYALICRQCDSHNGMALREEFEYFAFRCVYCNSWNPARKQKPSAPKLELDHTSVINQSSLSLVEMNKTVDKLPTSKSEDSIVLSESARVADSDIEVVEKPNEEENDDKSSQKSEEEGNESVEKPEVRAIEKMEVDESPTK